VQSLCSDHVALQICSLTDGEDFRAGPNLTPDQHIYRAANQPGYHGDQTDHGDGDHRYHRNQ